MALIMSDDQSRNTTACKDGKNVKQAFTPAGGGFSLMDGSWIINLGGRRDRRIGWRIRTERLSTVQYERRMFDEWWEIVNGVR